MLFLCIGSICVHQAFAVKSTSLFPERVLTVFKAHNSDCSYWSVFFFSTDCDSIWLPDGESAPQKHYQYFKWKCRIWLCITICMKSAKIPCEETQVGCRGPSHLLWVQHAITAGQSARFLCEKQSSIFGQFLLLDSMSPNMSVTVLAVWELCYLGNLFIQRDSLVGSRQNLLCWCKDSFLIKGLQKWRSCLQRGTC